MFRHPAAGELKMVSFWAGGISSFSPCAREYRLLRRLIINRHGNEPTGLIFPGIRHVVKCFCDNIFVFFFKYSKNQQFF